MPFVSRELLRLSLSALKKDYSPLLIVSVPCMLNRGVPVSASAADASVNAVKFGSSDEREWLDDYFRVGGGPLGKPYYMPGTGQWVEEDYPGKTLQRRRKDYDGTVFHHPDASRWAFRPDAPTVIKQKILAQKKQEPVPLVALMAWMWRRRALSTLDAALSDFRVDLKLPAEYLEEGVYSDTIPAVFRDAGLSDSPISDEELNELIGAAPPAPVVSSPPAMISDLERSLAESHVVLPPGFVERIIGGWLVGDIVVLVGAPGTGKTFLCQALGRGLERVFGKERFSQSFIEISPDMDSSQFLGYENLAGEFVAGRFTREVLFQGEFTDPRLVVLDEWNLAQIDAYFSSILSVIESHLPARFPGRVVLSDTEREDVLRAQPTASDGRWVLPTNTFIIATCNSWSDEPETRLPISGPVKRRCRIISMPNVLAVTFEAKGRDGLVEACNALLAQEAKSIDERKSSGQVSVWDEYRASRLAAIPTVDKLSRLTQDKLFQFLRILLEDPSTRSTITIGILKDVLLSCVYASNGREYDALGEQIADKILHQVHGSPQIAATLVDLSKDFANAKELSELGRRMGIGTGDPRLRPLV